MERLLLQHSATSLLGSQSRRRLSSCPVHRQRIVLRTQSSSEPTRKGREAGKIEPTANLRPSKQDTRCRASRDDAFPTTETQQGGGGGGARSKKGSGGDGDGESSGGAFDPTPLLLAAGKAVENLPADLEGALKAGKVPKDILQRYLNLDNSLLAPFLRIGGFRERLLADPNFFVKLSIEIGIGMCAKTTAELNKRGDNFSSELDFVLANVMMALIADFCLVWLPAPTVSFRKKQGSASFLKNNPIQRYFAGCPENAFQKVPSGYENFSLAQRAGAPLRNGLKLLGVGFGASLFGVGCTNLLITLRQALDSSFVPQNPPQDVLRMSAAYASYMAISSNLRYQVIAGVVEERGIEAFLGSNPRICNILSFLVRTGNTYLGSLWWVDYIRLLGLQKAPGISE